MQSKWTTFNSRKGAKKSFKKYLTQQKGDPIQSTLISSTIPGKGSLGDFDVGLGCKNSILRKLWTQKQPAQSGLLGSINNNLLGNLDTLDSLTNMDYKIEFIFLL